MKWFLASVVLLSFLSIAAAGCSDDDRRPKNPAFVAADAPEDETWNTSILFTDSTVLKARLKVRHARRYAQRLETLLDSGVYVEFYGPDGALNAILVADSARVDDRTNDMVAYGNVHVNSERSKTTVDTDRLQWTNSTRRLHSDAFVKVVDRMRGRIIQGTGYESDEALRNYKIYNVSGRTIPVE
ncbi:MAG: LPS export ABC transporter periplasmic protein LptC [Bacteroidetes bacterium]|nr:LPS export ABC transporter periplasmic protein LptC [Bacteroidota bacterium]